MTSEYTPTVGELRQAYVEAAGASMAQESYYAEQVAEFERGLAHIKAETLREALLSDEAVERAARVVAGMDPGEDWPTNAEMGGGPTGTRDDEYRSECVRTARAALTAALGEDESNE